MSGICGILRLDGAPAEGIGAMAAPLGRRGPDATRHWARGPVALGHALLATTPEALHERLPLVHEGSGCVVTADVRLDNREELIAALGLPPPGRVPGDGEAGPPPRGRVVGDGELILRAYLAWGEDCPARLLGDFAFAIWDPRARRLFAARDQMGMRQLAYAHLPGRLLAFATEPRAVLEAPGVPRDLDEGRIADAVESYLEMVDRESTFYAAVRRLPPAHVLVAGDGEVAVRRYWSLEPGPLLELGGDEAYEEAFRDVFAQAVRCRLRSAGPVGSMLSGGMDSGSVAAVASRLMAEAGRGPLPTFSVVDADPGDDPETRGVRATAAMLGTTPHLVGLGDLSGWTADLAAALGGAAEPFDALMDVPRAAYLAARRAGVRVVLDGVAGDTVLAEGDHLRRLARSGRWLQVWREAVGEERQWLGRRSRWRLLLGAARGAVVPDPLRRLRRRLPWPGDGRPGEGRLLQPDFARRVDLAGRVARFRRHQPPGWGPNQAWRAAVVGGVALLVGRERYDRTASRFAVEPRDPFMDLRVIGFCLRCPSAQMLRDGWQKHLLRRAMERELPASVVWKRGRHHLGLRMSEELVRLGAFPFPAPGRVAPQAEDLLRRATGLTYGQLRTEPLPPQLRWETWVLAHWLAEAFGAEAAD